MAYSLGLVLTNECNLTCAHCYRPPDGVHRLSLEDVRRICESIPVASVNLGTGENGLHPEFNAITEHLLARDIQTSLTTNGYTVQMMPEALVRSLAEVEFSFDFPTPAEQDAFRGPGAWDLARRAMARCKAMVSVSGYLIGSQEIGKMPLPPKAALEWWYQYYFATERGRAGYLPIGERNVRRNQP
jgi:MoaA/NifB/PqqE/SkfB family radical SAM enzyme